MQERCVVALGLIVFLTVHPSARALPLTTDTPFNWDVPDNDTSADNFIDDADDSLANLQLAHSSGNRLGSPTTDLPVPTTDAPPSEVPTESQFAEDLSREPSSTVPFLTDVEPVDATPTEVTTSESVPDWTTPQPEDTTLSQKSGRSLMVVLPYSVNNLTEDGIQELYTKAPLTRILGNESANLDPQLEATTTAPEPSSTTQAPRRRKPSRRPHPTRRRPPVPINHKPEFAEATVQSNRVPTTAVSVKSTTPRPTKPSVSAPIRDSVKDLLASIGLSPIPDTDTKPVMPVYTRPTTTTSTPSPDSVDVSSAAESLTPEMKDILKSIGLLPEAAEAPSSAPPTMSSPIITTQPIVPEVDPSSYVQFKPLPLEPSASREGVKVSNDMHEFLASFGLLPNVGPIRITSTPDEYFDINEMSKNRKSKALKSDAPATPPMEMPKIDPDMFTTDMKSVLGDLGLIKDSTAEQTRDHIFNPVEHSAKLDEKGETEKVIKLLSTIKDDTQSENITSTAEPHKRPKLKPKSKKRKPVREKLEENKGPSPLSLDELRLFLENSKNEVKRQQPTEEPADATEEPPGPEEPFFPEDFDNKQSDSSSTTASTTTSTTTTTTTTTEAAPSASANADALADSFGGQGDVPKGGSELPPARPNGLYFLLDWNTFFNVGEEGKNPVKLNFSPRIGDPKRFIPVTVP